MCCDGRALVRQTSITYLQRALLSHDLHSLTGDDWHACFTQVRGGQRSWNDFMIIFMIFEECVYHVCLVCTSYM